MADQSALVAAAAIVRGLAADSNASVTIHRVGGADKSIELPGPETPAKLQLERELAALVHRVHHLETRANSAGTTAFPDTPNETTDSVFGDEASSPTGPGRDASKPTRQVSVTRNGGGGGGGGGGGSGSVPAVDQLTAGVPLTDEALEGLREHVDDQSKLLDSQRQELAGVKAQLLQQEQLQEKALAIIEQERVATLERELWKHQKANEAFQKALREIGDILTAVARGDLSKRVRLNNVEMDPEITTFKRTINTMMDQLGDFSSEVSRVAREVGTEGILGGQAQIEGVDGIWKELTDNGGFPLSKAKQADLVACLLERIPANILVAVNIMAQNLTDQGKFWM